MLSTIAFGAAAILAIGFLIFVHELGHFLVAKKVGIRVEAFSIGFGPKVFGWKRGDTVYKLCLLPLGGYVKMAGEMPSDESTGSPDEFSAKTVGQRAWVVSAGVIMNIIVAFLLFPLAFLVGVTFDAPVIGYVVEGGPAWRADLRPGDEVLKVNGSDVLDFADIRLELAFAKPEADTTVLLRRDGETLERHVRPAYNGATGFNEIKASPTIGALSFGASATGKRLGIAPNDRILSINGLPTWAMIGIDPGTARFQSLFADPKASLLLEVERAGSKKIEMVTAAPDPGELAGDAEYRIGIEYWNTTVIDRIDTVAGLPSAAAAIDLRVGDRIVLVNGAPTVLAREFETCIDELRRAAPNGGPANFEVTVERAESTVTLKASGIRPDDLRRSVLLGAKEARFNVSPDSPAARGGLASGDAIVKVGNDTIDARTTDGVAKISEAVRKSGGKAMRFTVRRGTSEAEVEVVPEKRLYNKTLLDLAPYALAQRSVHLPLVTSIERGLKQVYYQGANILAFFRSVFTGRVSGKNVGGIIMIAQVSYNYAQQGVGKVLFFMGILSLNLAFLNILPIPVLDGGHLLFLILEKIKGGRVSEKAMNIAYWAGFLLIIALMLFVTFNDLKRAFQ